MAYAPTTQTQHATPIRNFFVGIFNALARISEADARAKEAEYLMSLSDAALAQKGLKRDEIARYVFRDIWYL